MSNSNSISKDARKLLAFGAGVGIEIRGADLEVVATRVRPTRINVLGRLTIPNFLERPAAEWGAEYTHFLRSAGLGHLAATVLLPRREVIVRQLALPGVAARDVEGAVRFQLDSLHPYGEDEISWGWSRLPYGAVLVGITRRPVVLKYLERFAEAGILVHSFTFSAAAIHAALRADGGGDRFPDGLVALSRSGAGALEVYGESHSRPVFSAEFDLAPARATALALSELRLPPDMQPLPLEEALPKPWLNPVENDLSRNALPYATALAGACPWLAAAANVLSPEQRQGSSRTVYLPTAALALVLLLMIGGVFGYTRYTERQYLNKLRADIAALEPIARRADDLDREIQHDREKIKLLDRFRAQTPADLQSLNEITRLIEPPSWLHDITLAPDSVRLSGEALQAPPLINILDSSPLFQNSTLDSNTRAGAVERFSIHAGRKYPNQ